AVGLELKVAGGVLGATAIALLAPLADLIWAPGLAAPMLLASLLPLMQAPEGVASASLIVRKRYDVRAGFLVVSMALRLGALALGSLFGVLETVAALVVAQGVATAAVGTAGLFTFLPFPAARATPLAEDCRVFERLFTR